MGRAPCCDKANVKKGPWSPEEDEKLKEYIEKYGTGGNWIALPQKAGLRRCGKSCRLRWLNYLRPNIKHGEFSDEEDRIICNLFANIGSRWSIIAAQLPGRTDNDIKNYWNTKLKKKLMMGIIPHIKSGHSSATLSSLLQASSSSYRGSNNNNSTYYAQQACGSFTGTLEHIPFSPISLMSSSTTASSTNASHSVLQVPQESFVDQPMQHYQVKDNILVFGGDQASCSSSDGSCSNQISHCRDTEYDQYGGYNNGGATNGEVVQMGGLQNYFYNHNGVEGNQKIMLSSSEGLDHQAPLDYGLEEIKQLISSTTTSSCNNFLFDENKTEERVMYY